MSENAIRSAAEDYLNQMRKAFVND
jgi:hypothetical protein